MPVLSPGCTRIAWEDFYFSFLPFFSLLFVYLGGFSKDLCLSLMPVESGS